MTDDLRSKMAEIDRRVSRRERVFTWLVIAALLANLTAAITQCRSTDATPSKEQPSPERVRPVGALPAAQASGEAADVEDAHPPASH